MIGGFLQREHDLNQRLLDLSKCSSNIDFLKVKEKDSRSNKAISNAEIKVDPMVSKKISVIKIKLIKIL